MGTLCIDLSIPEEEIDENDPLTWSLVWFDHEEFDWNEEYLSEDGLLHGSKALPDLKKLLELYFTEHWKNALSKRRVSNPLTNGIRIP